MDEDEIADLFALLGPVRMRRMFSGHGVYCDGLIFALALRGELFLKVDRETEDAFRSAGSAPFTYQRARRVVALSYWRLPDQALDDPEETARWARLAIGAAQRAEKVPRKPTQASGRKSRTSLRQ